MAIYKVDATITAASDDAEVTIDAEDIPMTASGGDQWDGSKNLDLPQQAVLEAAVVGVKQPWGIQIKFTPQGGAPARKTYKQDNITTDDIEDLV